MQGWSNSWYSIFNRWDIDKAIKPSSGVRKEKSAMETNSYNFTKTAQKPYLLEQHIPKPIYLSIRMTPSPWPYQGIGTLKPKPPGSKCAASQHRSEVTKQFHQRWRLIKAMVRKQPVFHFHFTDFYAQFSWLRRALYTILKDRFRMNSTILSCTCKSNLCLHFFLSRLFSFKNFLVVDCQAF